jgi:hypothetical protein
MPPTIVVAVTAAPAVNADHRKDCTILMMARTTPATINAVLALPRASGVAAGIADAVPPAARLPSAASPTGPNLSFAINFVLCLRDARAHHHHHCFRGALGRSANASSLSTTPYQTIAGGERTLTARSRPYGGARPDEEVRARAGSRPAAFLRSGSRLG